MLLIHSLAHYGTGFPGRVWLLTRDEHQQNITTDNGTSFTIRKQTSEDET